MIGRRLAGVLVAALCVQGAAFAWVYDDLIYLRLPATQLLRGGPERFGRQATRALLRPSLTRAHLDTIAEFAQAFDLPHLEVTALERRLALDPDDAHLKLRFAEALRRQGDRVRAERAFRELLEETP